MKLFQYWDTGAPPADVSVLVDGMRAHNPEMEHRLYDRDSAGWFIGKHLGAREKRAFEACAVPAMQSDYFRLCALLVKGGLYVDADLRSLRPLARLVEATPHGFMTISDGHLINGFLMVRGGGDPFLQACLRLCTLNIEAGDMPKVYTATGPGVFNAMRALIQPELSRKLARVLENPIQESWGFPRLLERVGREIERTPELVASWGAWTVLPKGDAFSWVERIDPAYKETERHWLNWQGSIYAGAAPK
jgi:hypothetical protein